MPASFSRSCTTSSNCWYCAAESTKVSEVKVPEILPKEQWHSVFRLSNFITFGFAECKILPLSCLIRCNSNSEGLLKVTGQWLNVILLLLHWIIYFFFIDLQYSGSPDLLDFSQTEHEIIELCNLVVKNGHNSQSERTSWLLLLDNVWQSRSRSEIVIRNIYKGLISFDEQKTVCAYFLNCSFS